MRTEIFRKTHPFCVFCGGGVLGTTIEHCPPRAMFQNRAWPEGFEFPACEKCNHGTADDDLIISLLARTDPFTDLGNRDGRLPLIIESVHQKLPALLSKMLPTAREARVANRQLGIVPPPGSTNQDAGPVHVTDEMERAVATFVGKLTKAIFYMQTGRIYPLAGRMGFKWFTKADLFINNGRYHLFETLEGLEGFVPKLTRSKLQLNDQFEYKVSIIEDGNLMSLQAKFGKGFGFVAFASTATDKLDSMFANLKSRMGKPNPFTML